MTQESANKTSFLLEIGSEEIPARFIPAAMEELQQRMERLLQDSHLDFSGLRVLATPRRLALLIEELDARQTDRRLQIKGPPVSVAFGADGQPTPAAEGFARKVGLPLEECGRQEGPKGEFLVADKLEKGRATGEILAEALPELILSVPYRKVMRWGDDDLEYPRPLQWLVALLGDEVVPARLGDLTAGRITRGHRTLARDRTETIARPADYEQVMENLGVMVDPARRRAVIAEGFARLLAERGPQARLNEDDELMEEVVFLCEYPTPFCGSFDEAFQVLPAEVITAALKVHQRYFSVGRGDGGGLEPCFLAVRDGGPDHLDKVTAGNERVLRARLADALFYWEFDQKKTPDERTEMLSSVTWLEGFGTILDKVERLEKLVPWLWSAGLGESEEVPAELLRATRLCRSDLSSEMIKDGKEFTKLEGLIGARYAALAGEPERVCTALERYLMPRSARGDLPGDRISSTLSIAERLDTVAGCWLAGFIPTGAKDPYALRRHVLSILRILLDLGSDLDLEAGLERALDEVSRLDPQKDRAEALAGLRDFVLTRVSGFFMDNLGTDPQVVRAVLPVRWRRPVDALAWVRALETYRERDDFQMLATGFKRCRNILEGRVLPVEELDACLDRWVQGGSTGDGHGFGDLPEELELDLARQVAAAAADLGPAERGGDYDRVFALLSALGPAIDAFFDGVRVNVEDPDLRELRHGFLREIHGIFVRYADFAEVAPVD